MIKIKFQFFGLLKKQIPAPFIEMEVEEGIKLNQLVTRLLNVLKNEGHCLLNISTLDECAIANESRVLDKNEAIHESCTLSLLPPVCGG